MSQQLYQLVLATAALLVSSALPAQSPPMQDNILPPVPHAVDEVFHQEAAPFVVPRNPEVFEQSDAVSFDRLQELSDIYPQTAGPTEFLDQTDATAPWWSGFICRWQTATVNWRYGSMYLNGCMPDGYYLKPVIESVATSDVHDGPLEVGLPLAKGGGNDQMQQVDGPHARPLSQISLDIAPPPGALPGDRASPRFTAQASQEHVPGTSRDVNSHTKYWNASLLNHQPLYFEDISLERHGYSHGMLEPVYSGTRFFATLPMLPYLMAAHPPQTTESTLGESRPGSAAPYLYQAPPVSIEGGLAEAAVITGLVFIIP